MPDPSDMSNLHQKLQGVADAAFALQQSLGVTIASAAGTADFLTPMQNRMCHRILNVFETGSADGHYDAVSILNDGPGKIRQITYGRSQTTEYSNLRELVDMYVSAAGLFSAQLRPYLEKIGVTPLTDDAGFVDLLQRAAREDPVMHTVQDAFFDKVYFDPAMIWAKGHGFVKALSALVIYDSFIQSGRIRQELRSLFPEKPPVSGGREEVWVRQYVEVRHQWLGANSNLAVRPTIYRTRDLLREVNAGNWDLSFLPFMANGTPVNDVTSLPTTPAIAAVMAAQVPEPHVVWSEIEPPAAGLVAAPADSAAGLATQILTSPTITLATTHVTTPADNANARQNILDTSQGRAASRSSAPGAPGGTVNLDRAMLTGMLELAKSFKFNVSEFCGAVHSPGSRHYAGVAADIDRIDGQQVNDAHPRQAEFRQRCVDLGATEMRGPNDEGHKTHIHAGWPRP